MMSYVDPDGVPPAGGAARVGSELRAARLHLGWNLEDIAAGLRIRQAYLGAIEQGNLSAMPGTAYAVGFVRLYASALGFDADEVARRFRMEVQEINQKTNLRFPAPVPQRGIPAGAVVLLGIVIAAAAYAGWYRYSGADAAKIVQTAVAPPDRLAAMAPQQQVQSPQVASIIPSSPPPVPGQQLAPQIAAPAPPIPVPVQVPVQVTIAPPAPIPAPPLVTSRVMLHAISGGWVQVREKQGQVLLNRVLRTGESWPVPIKPQLLLTTSNAGGMEVLVDGVPAAALGPAGVMRRDVSLDPEIVKAGLPLPGAAKWAAKPASTANRVAQ